MSDEEPTFLDTLMAWMRTPDPDEKKGREHWEYEKFGESDEVWSDFHLFHDDWVEIANKKEWYDSPHVPQIYTDHKKIVKQNMGMNRPFEEFYYENADNGDFTSEMYVEDNGLPSGNGNLRLYIDIDTQNPPSGENDACLVEYFVKGKINYKVPDGVDFLPRFIAYPINRFFKWAYLEFLAEEQIEYDGEYAQERINEYFQYIRKYHGEEPTQSKSRQAVFKPSVEDGVFFQ
jgi:hypothetical protein